MPAGSGKPAQDGVLGRLVVEVKRLRIELAAKRKISSLETVLLSLLKRMPTFRSSNHSTMILPSRRLNCGSKTKRNTKTEKKYKPVLLPQECLLGAVYHSLGIRNVVAKLESDA